MLHRFPELLGAGAVEIGLQVLGAVAAVATLIGLAYAVYVRRAQLRQKQLTYSVSRAIPLAAPPPQAPGFDLRLEHIDPETHRPTEIESAYLRYLRLINAGREPVRRDDLPHIDAPTVIVDGTTTLNIGLVKQTRPANDVQLGALERPNDVTASRNITFEYLNYRDGAVIQILTTTGGKVPRASLEK